MCNLLKGKTLLLSRFLFRFRPIAVFSSPLGRPFGIRGGGNFREVISVTVGSEFTVIVEDEEREIFGLETSGEGRDGTVEGNAGTVTTVDVDDNGMTDKSIGLVMVQEDTPAFFVDESGGQFRDGGDCSEARTHTGVSDEDVNVKHMLRRNSILSVKSLPVDSETIFAI